jgi:hypothetical protein
VIRAGQFSAVVRDDGYEIIDDEVGGVVGAVILPHARRSQIKRDASADVAHRHYLHQRKIRENAARAALDGTAERVTRRVQSSTDGDRRLVAADAAIAEINEQLRLLRGWR